MRLMITSLLILATLAFACRKDERITDDSNVKLSFSKDSILFDTIFTTVGSVTKKISILNKSTDAVKISEIKLSGGNISQFSININGLSTNSVSNQVLHGQDSLNLFVKVNIDPNAKNIPFLIQDSIILSTNGNRQVIQLLAYGQNAVFINNKTINANTTWSKTLPYVINDNLTISSGLTLTIQPGAKIYFHKDASLNIDGSIIANGTPSEPILFCSDRLESAYIDEPGQWKGIYITRTGNGIISNSIIKNASVGITSDSMSVTSNPKLILSQNIIKNMQVAAYIGYHSDLLAFNNLMFNCGNYLVYAVGGGRYNLKQNTFAGFNTYFPRKTAALTFSDYLSATTYNKLQIDLVNNMIWGTLENELDIQKKTTAISQINLSYNLIKTTNAGYSANFNLVNLDPLFTSTSLYNFELLSSSPAIKKGISLIYDPYFSSYLSKDLKNKSRIFPSTIGCYENF